LASMGEGFLGLTSLWWEAREGGGWFLFCSLCSAWGGGGRWSFFLYPTQGRPISTFLLGAEVGVGERGVGGGASSFSSPRSSFLFWGGGGGGWEGFFFFSLFLGVRSPFLLRGGGGGGGGPYFWGFGGGGGMAGAGIGSGLGLGWASARAIARKVPDAGRSSRPRAKSWKATKARSRSPMPWADAVLGHAGRMPVPGTWKVIHYSRASGPARLRRVLRGGHRGDGAYDPDQNTIRKDRPTRSTHPRGLPSPASGSVGLSAPRTGRIFWVPDPARGLRAGRVLVTSPGATVLRDSPAR